eukprot:Rmarinus@m.4792
MKRARTDDLHSWEKQYSNSWAYIEEDEDGRIRSAEYATQQERKKRETAVHSLANAAVQRGMLRYCIVILDTSLSMADRDVRPSRMAVAVAELKTFIRSFFDENPLSQIALLATSNAICEKVCDLNSSPRRFLSALDSLPPPSGEPSLENALIMAEATLSNIPTHGSREVLIVYGSIHSRDPGDIHARVQSLKKNRVRCSVVSLAPEMFILRKLTTETQGRIDIALDVSHFRQMLKHHLQPPPVQKELARSANSMVLMGFPSYRSEDAETICGCHSKRTRGGYICPRCLVKVCDLPSVCPVCQMQLISAVHLARSYHHLFPIAPFRDEASPASASAPAAAGSEPTSSKKKKTSAPAPETWKCFGCRRVQSMATHGILKCICPRCEASFCVDCDMFLHESLHNCPGCELQAKKPSANGSGADTELGAR